MAKAATTKKAVPKKTGTSRKKKPKPTEEEIYMMIAQSAYYKAEKRNFEPGYEEIDWYQAEQEIHTLIK